MFYILGRMKVAVTGAAGYLGSNLIPQLVERGHEVVAIDRVAPATTDPAVTWVEGDVLDAASMRTALDGAEVVYHLVALITLAKNNDLAWRVNTEGVRVTAEAALEVGARRFVHTSSIHAFDQYRAGGHIDETSQRSDDPDLPVYDRSKWTGELSLRPAIERGLDAVIVNPTGVFGPVDNLRQLSRVNRTTVDSARGRVPVMIGGGFDMVDVRDVALGLILAGEKGRTGENYLLGGHMITLIELCRIAARHAGVAGPRFAIPAGLIGALMPVLEPISKRLGSDVISKAALGAIISAPVVDHGKAERELGYRPRPIQESIHDLVDFALAPRHA
ncbi:dihydroflavonol-4-reductase [Nocardia caishijiensis]|uniref:Dihydroflavonol-4-reductase n=2 Tax=Nocardia caishijiensis TaxID=184756 RepID=A0ABQ6YNV2_9NOCA|nr:dihydroflavonol-4-reductase [Nocardia caishijiensis]